MPALALYMDPETANGSPSYQRLIAGPTVHVQEAAALVRVPGGMQSGASSVAIVAPLPDGSHVVIETSLALFDGAAHAFRGAEERDADLAAARGPAPDASKS